MLEEVLRLETCPPPACGLRTFQEKLRWSLWLRAEDTWRFPVPAKFHYESGSLFGCNTTWKLQPTTVFTEHGKTPVHRIAVRAGTKRFPSASQMCARVPSAREANTVPPVPSTVGPIDVTALHVPSVPREYGWNTGSTGRRYKRNGCSYTGLHVFLLSSKRLAISWNYVFQLSFQRKLVDK